MRIMTKAKRGGGSWHQSARWLISYRGSDGAVYVVPMHFPASREAIYRWEVGR